MVRRLTATEIRVCLLEGDPPCLERLATALARRADIMVTGPEPPQPQLSALLRVTRPHVLLVALLGLRQTTTEALQFARATIPGVGLIAVTPQPCSSLLVKAASMGASACIAADTPGDYAASIVRRVYQGEHPLRYDFQSRNDAALSTTAPSQAPGTPEPPVALSARELAILQQVALGLANKQIAHSFGIGEQTVKNHVSAILRKLGAHDRAHAVYLAVQHGWIPSPGSLYATPGGSPIARTWAQGRG